MWYEDKVLRDQNLFFMYVNNVKIFYINNDIKLKQ